MGEQRSFERKLPTTVGTVRIWADGSPIARIVPGGAPDNDVAPPSLCFAEGIQLDGLISALTAARTYFGWLELDSCERIQLSRAKGFSLKAESALRNGRMAVKIDRSTKWGNPFDFRMPVELGMTPREERENATECFQKWLFHPDQIELLRAARRELHGKNLACWCPADHPCHGDVLLLAANTPLATEGL